MKHKFHQVICKMKKSGLVISIVIFVFVTSCSNPGKNDIINLVDPFIGTGGHGHTYPGATVPFGMVQLSPDTRKDNWDACSGYHYSDTAIFGFSHTHLSGTGVGDYGDIRFMAMTGDLKIRPGVPGTSQAGYSSRFSHKNETASPGYYHVFLSDPGIDVELTATPRCGIQKYTFPENDNSYIILDLKESVVSEKVLESSVKIINDHEVSGFRRSSGWAENQAVYFYAIFSTPFKVSGLASDGQLFENMTEAAGTDIQAYFKFITGKNETILVKVGISSVGEEGARKNLESEVPGWDFAQVKGQAEELWKKELSRIEVKSKNHDDLIKFYTALYHCLIVPNLFSDIDGQYRGHDGQTHTTDDYDYYSVFSLWDTYRAWHPLMTIIQPKRTKDFIRTFIDISDKGGLLPVWELAGNETNCMIGYHAVPVIADAYLKGITDYDGEKAFSAMKKSATADQFGLRWYRQLGYIPAECEGESISKTLEYAYDDWCIAMMAGKMNKAEEYQEFIQRAQNYKNLFDPDTKFLRGKRNGMFTQPFDATEVNFMLTEANTWQYTFYVPQDIGGLIDMMGGDRAFEEKLDEMFNTSASLSGRQQADITGLIGQYAHGNEPSHHMTYLYNYIGKPEKTQKLAREVMGKLYDTNPGGLCGNEDCGQMSAWYVLSALGIYPVTPGSGYYVIGSPIFDEAVIHLENGKDFLIKTDNNSGQNRYIQSAKLNNSNYSKSYIDHSVLLSGGTLELKMGPEVTGEWGKKIEDRPVSAITSDLITPVPFFEAASQSFQDTLNIKIRHLDANAKIFWKEGEKSAANFEPYVVPIRVNKAISLDAYALADDRDTSKTDRSSFNKIHNDWKISITNPYNPQYTGGGEMALVDGQHGGPNFRTGSWQGYHGVDFEATIDMGKPVRIGKISATFLHDQRSWIFLPVSVYFYISQNGDDYSEVANLIPVTDEKIPEAVIEEFSKKDLNQSCRFIKIKGVTRGTCPDWHVGAGDQAWIFVDEITIE